MRKAFTPYTLNLMLNLRLLGFSVNYLAEVFECDKKAIKYQCKKHGVFPWEEGNFNPRAAVSIILPELLKDLIKEEERWKYIDDERINTGRNYADYLIPPLKTKATR